MTYDTNKLRTLFSRVARNEMQEADRADIKELIKKVFGNGESNPDPALLHQFNEVIVKTADEIAKPQVTEMLGLFANKQNAQRGNIVKINLPKKAKARITWAATGSGVDLIRVGDQDHVLAVPATMSTGFYYEPLSLVQDDVEAFQRIVDEIAAAKVKLYLDQIYMLINAAATSGKIPAANRLSGSNLTTAQYNKLASTISRVAGGKTIFVADSLMIDYFAMQQATAQPQLLTDRIREDIVSSLNPTEIGRTIAANLTNPFTDDTNSKTELPVNQGFMFSGGTNKKPFEVVEYGGLRQLTEQDIEDERVKLKLTQDASVQLIYGNAIGVVKEDAAVAL